MLSCTKHTQYASEYGIQLLSSGDKWPKRFFWCKAALTCICLDRVSVPELVTMQTTDMQKASRPWGLEKKYLTEVLSLDRFLEGQGADVPLSCPVTFPDSVSTEVTAVNAGASSPPQVLSPPLCLHDFSSSSTHWLQSPLPLGLSSPLHGCGPALCTATAGKDPTSKTVISYLPLQTPPLVPAQLSPGPRPPALLLFSPWDHHPSTAILAALIIQLQLQGQLTTLANIPNSLTSSFFHLCLAYTEL